MNTNINQAEILGLLKYAKKKVETEMNIKSTFKVIGIWPLKTDYVVKPVTSNKEDFFMILDRASDPLVSQPQPTSRILRLATRIL